MEFCALSHTRSNHMRTFVIWQALLFTVVVLMGSSNAKKINVNTSSPHVWTVGPYSDVSISTDDSLVFYFTEDYDVVLYEDEDSFRNCTTNFTVRAWHSDSFEDPGIEQSRKARVRIYSKKPRSLLPFNQQGLCTWYGLCLKV